MRPALRGGEARGHDGVVFSVSEFLGANPLVSFVLVRLVWYMGVLGFAVDRCMGFHNILKITLHILKSNQSAFSSHSPSRAHPVLAEGMSNRNVTNILPEAPTRP